MASTTEKYTIFGGPDKSDFLTSLSYGDHKERAKIHFGVVRTELVKSRTSASSSGSGRFNRMEVGLQGGSPALAHQFIINGVTREDGSGKRWLFTGFLADDRLPWQKVRGFYNTHTRDGWVVIEM